MVTLEWNPQRLDVAAYVEALNVCYGGGWDARLYRWYLARPYRGRSPDVIVTYRDGEPVAGSGVNYRTLRSRGGRTVDVGIVTGSWTLPGERGHGHFTRMMRESVIRAGARGCGLLLAFVTDENPSRRGLARCGALMVPSWYLVSKPERAAARPDSPEIERVELSAAGLRRWFRVDEEATRFHYERTADWRAQFLERPHSVEALRFGRGSFALVERAPDTDRLQLLTGESDDRARAVASLAARAAAANRCFFMYSTGGWARSCAAEAGLELRPGSVTCLPTGKRRADVARILEAPVEIHSGDRM